MTRDVRLCVFLTRPRRWLFLGFSRKPFFHLSSFKVPLCKTADISLHLCAVLSSSAQPSDINYPVHLHPGSPDTHVLLSFCKQYAGCALKVPEGGGSLVSTAIELFTSSVGSRNAFKRQQGNLFNTLSFQHMKLKQLRSTITSLKAAHEHKYHLKLQVPKSQH